MPSQVCENGGIGFILYHLDYQQLALFCAHSGFNFCNSHFSLSAAQIITRALQKEGFDVELMDKDDLTADYFQQRLKELQGATVRVTCGNVKLHEAGV